MTNVGTRPTFEPAGYAIETHLPGFEGSLYSQRLRVRFLERIRDEKRFESAEALKAQIARDLETIAGASQALGVRGARHEATGGLRDLRRDRRYQERLGAGRVLARWLRRMDLHVLSRVSLEEPPPVTRSGGCSGARGPCMDPWTEPS